MPNSKIAEAPRTLKVALIGNPNTGKSTLFNALAGARSRIGNFPGVTVEKKIGRARWRERTVELIDLPGTYSLAPRSLDEMVAVNVLLGKLDATEAPEVVVCIVDASNLERNLYLVSQVLDLGLPAVVVLNMWDVAQAKGLRIDHAALASRLGIPVVTMSAHKKMGVADLPRAIEAALSQGPPNRPNVFPAEFLVECDKLGEKLSSLGRERPPVFLLERWLLDVGGFLESNVAPSERGALLDYLGHARQRLAAKGCRVPAVEAQVRYGWIRKLLDGIVTYPTTRPITLSDRIDSWLTHGVVGLLAFVAVMFLVFQAITTGYRPLKELCEAGLEFCSNGVAGWLAPGPLRSLIIDGVIAGVGGVLVFLPQIVLLFLFIALLEDCGYMARAAFLMDKLMTQVGLSGRSFVPLMSSFACAVPGVMATRVIENRRDRMVTILVAPLMSCSARLPVYILLTAAFIPQVEYLNGWVDLHGLVLLGMSSLGAIVAIPVAWLLKTTLFRGETPPFVMELPSYKWPSPWIVFSRVYDSGKAFVLRAGTLILATSVVIWGAGYYPGDHAEADRLEERAERLSGEVASNPDARMELEEIIQKEKEAKAQLLENSLLGRLGHAVEPVVSPLGWDWKIGVGAIASFPAREVIISTLGTIYRLGSEVDEENSGLQNALQEATWPDGSKVYTIPVALSIMVFFALCAQCASTLMIIKRETNGWRWPAFTFGYMTLLAYCGALLTYNLGRWWI